MVSSDLQCLVNELCETGHDRPLQLKSNAARRKAREMSGNPAGTASWQLFKIGDRLPAVIFCLPFDTL